MVHIDNDTQVFLFSREHRYRLRAQFQDGGWRILEIKVQFLDSAWTQPKLDFTTMAINKPALSHRSRKVWPSINGTL